MLKCDRYMQYLASISACLSSTMVGMLLSWPSPTLPILASNHSPIGRPITIEEGSWLVALLQFGPLLTMYPAIIIMKKFGRKVSLLLSAIPNLLSWIIIFFSQSIYLLYIARILAGMGTTFSNTSISIYIGEIADKDVRGKLGTFFNLMKLIGCVIVFSAGPFLSYYTLAIVCGTLPIIFIIIFVNMPESPYFLVKKRQIGKASKSLMKLNKKLEENNIDDQMENIKNTLANEDKNKSISTIFNVRHRKVLLIMFGIKTIQQMSGSVAIDSYMQTILEASDIKFSPSIVSIIYGIIQIPAVIFAAVLVDTLGRKPMFIASTLGCSICLFIEGLYFYIQDVVKNDVSSYSWIPITALILYAVMNNLGISTLPYILLGELFSMNIKEVATTISIFYGTILAFIVSKCFEPYSMTFGRHTVFWTFALFSILGTVFVHIFVPETKSKTLDQIQKDINGNKI